MDNNDKISISGLVFFIEITCLYIIDDKGKICLIHGKEEIISKFKEKNVYQLQNLEYIKNDNRNYHLYNINNKTNIKTWKGMNENYAIIKLIILEKINPATNPQLKLNNYIYNIIDKIQYFPLFIKDKESTYNLELFELIINNKSKTFKIFIYKNEVNIIHCSLKEKNIMFNKNYEIIYLSKDSQNLPKEIYVSGYKIDQYDKFSCSNRIRFNIMNVKKDNKLYDYNDNLSSYEIIYLINENKEITRYGVFDLSYNKKEELKEFSIEPNYASIVKKFYEDYNYDKNNKKTEEENKEYYLKELIKLSPTKDIKEELFKENNRYISIYKKESLNTNDAFIYFRNYSFFIYFNLIIALGEADIVDKYFELLDRIQIYDNYSKIRLLSQYINIIKNNDEIPKLIDINHLDKNNPYYLAIKLQKDIISNLNEKSNIFYPILQFNSKILKILPDDNFSILKEKIKKLLCINNNKKFAYTISLENIEEMKSHLLSIEEDFFFIITKKNNNNFFGLYNKYTKIMVINEYNLFNGVSAIEANKKKDYAFSLNIVFSQERMSHGKENSCNQGIDSPCIYFNIDFKKDYIYSSYSNVGEAGKVFENFIAHPILIKALKVNKNLGNFLNYKYFIGDFKEIKNEVMKKIKNNIIYKTVQKNILKRILTESSIFILIISSLFYFSFHLNHIFIISISVILSILYLKLLLKNYMAYNDPFKDNNTYYDIINENNNNNGKESQILIYPDDYPFESDTFLGKYFPFLEFEKNKIREKLKKYTNPKDGNYY